jgi:hypothetical protein
MAPTRGGTRAIRPAHRLPRAHRVGIYNMLTPLCSRIVVAGDVYTRPKLCEDSLWKTLGEDISKLPTGRHVKNLYMAKSNLIADKMEINLNMLRALMLYWVAGHVDGADVVAENHRSSMERGVELQQELVKPGSLSHSIGDCMILGLSAREGDCRLAFGGPGDEVSTEEHLRNPMWICECQGSQPSRHQNR